MYTIDRLARYYPGQVQSSPPVDSKRRSPQGTTKKTYLRNNPKISKSLNPETPHSAASPLAKISCIMQVDFFHRPDTIIIFIAVLPANRHACPFVKPTLFVFKSTIIIVKKLPAT